MTLLNAEELFKNGDLSLAVQSAAEQVKQNPSDEHIRVFYIELLCVNGDFEKADQQLSSLIVLKPDLGLVLATWRQLVHAAQIRQDVFELKAKPELIDEATPSIISALDLIIATHENDVEKIDKCINSINDNVALSQYAVNNYAPQPLRDLNDITANLFEVLGMNGKYFWVDFSQVIELEIHKPERIIEQIWRKANIVLTNGTEGVVYIPAIYPAVGDDLAALGRKTEWQVNGNAYYGIGLRSWLEGENELSINSESSLIFKNMLHVDEEPQVTRA